MPLISSPALPGPVPGALHGTRFLNGRASLFVDVFRTEPLPDIGQVYANTSTIGKASRFDHVPIWVIHNYLRSMGQAFLMSVYDPAYQEYLRRLRKARELAGLTQVEAGKMLGKPHSLISKCEMGERRVNILEALKFGMIYRKSINYFTRGLLR
jgi:hypothetical protein